MDKWLLIDIATVIHEGNFGGDEEIDVNFGNDPLNPWDENGRRLLFAQNLAERFEKIDPFFNHFAFIHLAMTGENRF